MREVTVKIDIGSIPSEVLIDEIDERADDLDPDVEAAMERWGSDWADDNEREIEPQDEMFARLSDWDRERLIQAINADDGRRVIDILKTRIA